MTHTKMVLQKPLQTQVSEDTVRFFFFLIVPYKSDNFSLEIKLKLPPLIFQASDR